MAEVENNKLIMRAKSAEVRLELEKDPDNPQLWYKLGMAVAEEEGLEAAIDLYSQALVLNPFSALLYFGRGRRQIGLRKYLLCIADMTMAQRLEPHSFHNWYYRAIARYLNDDFEGAIQDLNECHKYTRAEEKYPLYVWLFRAHWDGGQKDKARTLLDSIETDLIPSRMDYGYRRQIQLLKGDIKAEDMIDLEDLEAHSLVKQAGMDYEARLQLEVESMTYSLYTYYNYVGEQDKANESLLKIAAFKPSAAFGYLAGTAEAKKRGLIS